MTQHQGEQLRLYLSQLEEVVNEYGAYDELTGSTVNEHFSASITLRWQNPSTSDQPKHPQESTQGGNDTLLSFSLSDAQSVTNEPQPISNSTLFGLKPSQSSLDLSKVSTSLPSEPTHPQVETHQSSDLCVDYILGEGGMGRVYSGRQTCLKREVALKVSKIKPHEPQLIAQVFHEAQIMANLDHPNILPIYLLALDKEHQPVQVMKQINGVTWSELLSDSKHIFWAKLDYPDGKTHFHLQVLAQVCQAMSYAHDHKVIHRDLKPENVMIGGFGEIFILDWGVALYLPAIGCREDETDYVAQVRSNLAAALVGTPVYMPPEMARCDVSSLGPWSDVYLLGAILYEILCRRRIRESGNIQVMFNEIMKGHIPELPTFVSEEFRSLLKASLTSNIDERIPNAHSFRKLLLHAIRTQKAAKVHQRAHDLQLELRNEIGRGEGSREEISSIYDQARLTYRTSLEMWSECERAQAGLDELHALWAQYLIDHEDLAGAKRALSRLQLPHPELNRRLEEAIDERSRVEKEHATLQKWRENEQISHSRPLRIIFATIGLIVFGCGSLLLDYLERNHTITLDSRGEFITAISFSIFVYFAFAISAIQRRRSSVETNAIFQRLIAYLVVISIAVTLQRYVSWQIGLPFKSLLHVEMTLISLGCFGLSFMSGKRDFIWGGIAYAVMSLFSISYPQNVPTFFSVAMMILWLGVLISWWKDRPSILFQTHSENSAE